MVLILGESNREFRNGKYSGSDLAEDFFLFAIRLVVRVRFVVLPFLVINGAIAWFLLTDYDINYYLAQKLPVFMAAATVIDLLLIMLVLLLRRLLGWSLALPLLLFAEVSPAVPLSRARR
jgi:glycerophosphoryl diester phosphodiesterase